MNSELASARPWARPPQRFAREPLRQSAAAAAAGREKITGTAFCTAAHHMGTMDAAEMVELNHDDVELNHEDARPARSRRWR